MSEDQVKLRKYEHILAISGAGVIAFGLWSIVKAVIYVILSPVSQFSQVFTEEDMAQLNIANVGEREADIALIVLILFGMVLDVLLRIYVGRRAISEGRFNRKRRFVYVVLAFFIAVGMLMQLVRRLVFLFGPGSDPMPAVIRAMSVSWIVDVTSLLALIELIIAAIMVRRLRKETD